jgi:acyl-CoA oxidase
LLLRLVRIFSAYFSGVNMSLYYKTVDNMGTEKHKKYLERIENIEDIGCFSLTELGHGSNVRGIETEARYDPKTKDIVINTPNEVAMKFWIGGAAKTSNITVVFAQLYDVEGTNQGVHAMIVPIRDSKHMPIPGITLGDCGKKAGLDGIDNGFLLFKNIHIPVENLLDRYSSLSEEGRFTSPFKSADTRFAVSLGSLSGGRIVLSQTSVRLQMLALTIAIRYATMRR